MLGSAMLRADTLVFDYGQQAVLRGVDLRVPSGGLLGILGPNGSGKTTLLKLLAGLLTPARGCVSLDGVDVAGMVRTALARRLRSFLRRRNSPSITRCSRSS